MAEQLGYADIQQDNVEVPLTGAGTSHLPPPRSHCDVLCARYALFAAFVVVSPAALLLSRMTLTRAKTAETINEQATVQIAGRYSFVSQENFEDYLKAEDLGMIKRSVMKKERPDISVGIDGDNFTVTIHEKLKTIKISFTLGKEYQCDPGTGKVNQYITTLEGGATLMTKKLDDNFSTSSMKFTSDGLSITMQARGVTAIRSFKRS